MTPDIENKPLRRRVRILYVSFIPPTPGMGTAMAYYRHFVERNDFELKVVTNLDPFPFASVPYKPVLFGRNRIRNRLFKTRLMPWLHGIHSLTSWGRIPARIWREAETFKPDLVFTIVAGWDYSALVAWRMAQKFKIPLVTSFNDWFDYGGLLPHPFYHKIIEARFRRLYQKSDLAFCTCEGMKEALGKHRNVHVLYPIGAKAMDANSSFHAPRENGGKFVVVFAGNLGNWYGPMLENLATAAIEAGVALEFRFYGSGSSWSREFDERAKAEKIFRGHLAFDELRKQMEEADVLLLPMGFEKSCEFAERTSFKTKFLDYLTFRKPIVVWGPEYCSAVRFAREFDSAEVCLDSNPEYVLSKILSLSRNVQRQAELVANAEKMYQERFHPDRIHIGLVGKLQVVADLKSQSSRMFKNCKAG